MMDCIPNTPNTPNPDTKGTMNRHRTFQNEPCLGPLATTVTAALFLALRANAVVTPAPDRAFCPHPTTGSNILAQLAAEASNPRLATVVYLANSDPMKSQ